MKKKLKIGVTILSIIILIFYIILYVTMQQTWSILKNNAFEGTIEITMGLFRLSTWILILGLVVAIWIEYTLVILAKKVYEEMYGIKKYICLALLVIAIIMLLILATKIRHFIIYIVLHS